MEHRLFGGVQIQRRVCIILVVVNDSSKTVVKVTEEPDMIVNIKRAGCVHDNCIMGFVLNTHHTLHTATELADY